MVATPERSSGTDETRLVVQATGQRVDLTSDMPDEVGDLREFPDEGARVARLLRYGLLLAPAAKFGTKAACCGKRHG